MRTRRHALCALLAALPVAGLLGCGNPSANPMGLPTLDERVTAPVAATLAPAPSAAVDGAAGSPSPTPAALPTARLGRLSGSALGQQALVGSVVDYMTVRVQIANTWAVDDDALARVAAGRAAATARRRVEVLREADRRVVGSYVVNASRVTRSGDRATVAGCMEDLTSEVDPIGQTVVGPPGGQRISFGLRRSAGRWLVVDVPRGRPPFCSAGAS